MDNPKQSMYVVMYHFSRIANERLREAIRTRKIGVSHNLRGSISFRINHTGDDVRSLEFRYLNYGKFVDMGVGKGMPLGSKADLKSDYYKKRNSQGQLLNHARKPNPWYSKTIYRENMALADVLEKQFGLALQNTVNESLPTIINISM